MGVGALDGRGVSLGDAVSVGIETGLAVLLGGGVLLVCIVSVWVAGGLVGPVVFVGVVVLLGFGVGLLIGEGVPVLVVFPVGSPADDVKPGRA